MQRPAMHGNGQQTMASGPKTLHVYHAGSFSKWYNIIDSDKSTILYTVGVHAWTRPDIHVYSVLGSNVDEKTEIGSGTFHSLSTRVDMVVRGQGIQLSRNGAFSSGHQWRSPALGGMLVKWKKDGVLSRDKICYVEGHKDTPIARWQSANTLSTKEGKIHILDPSLAAVGSSGFDEIVFSAIIEMEVTRRQQDSGAN